MNTWWPAVINGYTTSCNCYGRNIPHAIILPKWYSTLTFEFAKQHLINIQYSLIKNLNLTTKHSVIPRQETKHGLCSSCLACLVRRTLTKLTNNERSFIAITSFSTNEDVRIKLTSYHHINMLLLCTHSSCRYDIPTFYFLLWLGNVKYSLPTSGKVVIIYIAKNNKAAVST